MKDSISSRSVINTVTCVAAFVCQCTCYPVGYMVEISFMTFIHHTQDDSIPLYATTTHPLIV